MKQADNQDRQAAAVVKEFREALEDGHLERAWNIYRSNPDLRDVFDEIAGDPLDR